MRIGAAQRGSARGNSDRFLVPGYCYMPRADRCRTVLPNGAAVFSFLLCLLRRRQFVLCRVCLVCCVCRGSEKSACVPIRLPLPLPRYTTLTGAVWEVTMHII